MRDATIAEKTTPYWWDAAPVRPIPARPLPQAVDVAIVGAGFAGLSAGLVLAREGRSVAAFDAMNPGEGASTRNGGITSGNIRLDYATMAKRFGEARAIAVEAEAHAARQFLYRFIAEEGLDCDLQRPGLFKGAIGYAQYDAMARGAEALRKAVGIETWAVPFAEQTAYVGSDFYRGGAVRMDIGGLHPGKLHGEILRIAQEAGLGVHSGTPVTGVTRDGDGFRVATASGTVRARQVLVCTNGYTDGAAPFLRRRLVPVRSRIIVTEALAPEVMARLMPKRMMISEGRQLGHYYRPTPDGRRILLGGRESGHRGNPVGPSLLMRAGLAQIFPELEGVRLSHTWFGNVAMNRDMLPRIFEKDGILYASGFCGSGTVWAPWIGMRAAYKLLGQGARAESAFDFRPPASIPLYRGDPWFMPTIIQGYRLQDRIAMLRARR
ncbi:FAD-binding oxidoreductase [Methylobacterium terricola]|uniref:FAD-binding oxidoreductase n=1 Tax=Methylobacterium terricola TaxID=2583531 RepID=A0A5C4L7S3_9HYPH|nr:FAD-binding oxidoreductase [Methylobacterium terricola]TNC05647.1 FAD-binding oxidoreductase [Methylobacterium terricola]